MNKMKIKKLIFCSIITSCILLNIVAYASPIDICIYGSEKSGYRVSSSNLIPVKNKSFTYNMKGLTGKYKSSLLYGIKQWQNTGFIKYKEDKTSKNVVKVVKKSTTNSKAVASTGTSYYVQSGGIAGFTMSLYAKYMDKMSLNECKSVLTHELGHTFGLLDLYNKKYNSKQIMYGVTEFNPLRPSSKDIKGAKYSILGQK